MFIIRADYIFLCDEDFTVLKDKALVFDERIKDLGDFKALNLKYPQAKIINTPKNSLILPAFINTHTHLEFSANAYTLHYGDFLIWLKSVINSRSVLNEKAKEELILNTIKTMQRSGIGTIGEISSFGSDLDACVKSSARIVFFNELLGVNEEQNSAKKAEFLQRFNKSKEFKNDLFMPALSIHSPYSTNKSLARFVLDLAHKEGLLISTHFLESNHENLWLRSAKGGFKRWLSFFEPNPKPCYTVSEFIELFKGLRTLFTHCVYVKEEELELFDENLHHFTHCAFSNRLLSKKSLNLKLALKHNIKVHLGTDGLSSNISLSMLDEMRANLLIHSEFKNLEALAKRLILMSTLYPARALNLELGELKVGKIADLSVFELGSCENSQIALQFLLNSKTVKKLFIKGQECKL
ncbi:aminofutalosine deaminase family hydrolase [Campylobacter troglodytis]|uniref:aminofutalosine deaminase family hydrolase n=1 Tax=Campylobacter troglodytis TaxID=654363 RepID=UPI00115C2F9E|nr:metal-dependent hydrolase [Campylobacter troglodytis]TQR56893.1 metal-dependent hydrolase [Campylobacter troglodytis]